MATSTSWKASKSRYRRRTDDFKFCWREGGRKERRERGTKREGHKEEGEREEKRLAISFALHIFISSLPSFTLLSTRYSTCLNTTPFFSGIKVTKISSIDFNSSYVYPSSVGRVARNSFMQESRISAMGASEGEGSSAEGNSQKSCYHK